MQISETAPRPQATLLWKDLTVYSLPYTDATISSPRCWHMRPRKHNYMSASGAYFCATSKRMANITFGAIAEKNGLQDFFKFDIWEKCFGFLIQFRMFWKNGSLRTTSQHSGSPPTATLQKKVRVGDTLACSTAEKSIEIFCGQIQHLNFGHPATLEKKVPVGDSSACGTAEKVSIWCCFAAMPQMKC